MKDDDSFEVTGIPLPMTPKEFHKEMKKLAKDKDKESRHRNMDNILVTVLRQLGYDKGCDVYDNTEKWYA